jgi:uracil-DNA glycosylase
MLDFPAGRREGGAAGADPTAATRRPAMASHQFDPGYVEEPFRSLCEDYPAAETYPADDFRVEWGPVFHRGRLDGSARVVVVGQDPAQHEVITRRILVGAAGQRTQGFLAKLGIQTSYVMVNTFLYSVYGQGGGERHADDAQIAAYRNRWLDALLVGGEVEAVVALGRLAARAFQAWQATPAGQGVEVAFEHVTHPTAPESSSQGDPDRYAEAVAAMLRNWNEALERLRPAVRHPDVDREPVPYGEALTDADYAPIPERDLPAGLPEWMRSRAWADRRGRTPDLKRATIVVTVPRAARPWT